MPNVTPSRLSCLVADATRRAPETLHQPLAWWIADDIRSTNPDIPMTPIVGMVIEHAAAGRIDPRPTVICAYTRTPLNGITGRPA